MNDPIPIEDLIRFAMRWNLREKIVVFSMFCSVVVIAACRFLPVRSAVERLQTPSQIVVTQYVRVVETQVVEKAWDWTTNLCVTNLLFITGTNFVRKLDVTNLTLTPEARFTNCGGNYRAWSTNIVFY